MEFEEIAIKIIEAHPELAGTEELARMIDEAIKDELAKSPLTHRRE